MALHLPSRQLQPGWVMPGSVYADLDFAGNRYFSRFGGSMNFGQSGNTSGSIRNSTTAGFISQGFASAVSGSPYFAPDTNGLLKAFPQETLRITGYGLWCEGSETNNGQLTNYALHSRDLTQSGTWTAVNVTTSKTAVGADGTANSGTIVTAGSALGTILQTQTLTSRVYCGSFYVKAITVTGAINMCIDGSTYTNIAASLNTNGYVQVSVPYQTLTATSVGFQFANSGDSIAVDMAMLASNNVPTTPILTTTVAVEGGEILYLMGDSTTTPTNFGQQIVYLIGDNKPCSLMVQYSGLYTITNPTEVYDPASTSPGIVQAAGGGACDTIGSSGTATTANSATTGLFNLNKVITSYGGGSTTSNTQICLNGGAVASATGTFEQSPITVNHAVLGSRGQGDRPINGYIKRMTVWDRALTAGQMIQYSTVTNNM